MGKICQRVVVRNSIWLGVAPDEDLKVFVSRYFIAACSQAIHRESLVRCLHEKVPPVERLLDDQQFGHEWDWMSPRRAVFALSVQWTYSTPESYAQVSPVKVEAGQDNSPPQQCFEIGLINCHSGCHDGDSRLPMDGELEMLRGSHE